LGDAVRRRASEGAARFTLLVRVPPTACTSDGPEEADELEAQAILDRALPMLSSAAGSPVDGLVATRRH